jgi:DNA-binding LytR/AlgR family response regulator
MIRVLIVEDEPLALSRLRSALALHEDIELVGEATNGPSAVQAISTLDPSLLFLDVRLPGFSGLEVLRNSKRSVSVIFTTAHDEYAVHAFEWGAFDYLLKPFDDARVARALERYRTRSRTDAPETQMIERLDVAESSEFLEQFFVKRNGVTIPVRTSDIESIAAEGDYCRVYVEQTNHLVHVPMREFERRLDSSRFVRIHRSTIIQVSRIVRIEALGRGALLHLKSGMTTAASRAGSSLLRERIPFTRHIGLFNE